MCVCIQFLLSFLKDYLFVHQVDSLKKSEQWYREQLHSVQAERSTLQKQLMTAQEDVVRQAHSLEKLTSDLKRTQGQLCALEEKGIKEKQNFTRQLEKAIALSSHSESSVDSVNLRHEVVSNK